MENNDSLILRMWDCTTKYILKFSLLQHLIVCLKEGCYEKKDERKLYDGIDFLMLMMSCCAIGIVLCTYHAVKNGHMTPVIQWIIVIIGSYRLIEIMTVQVRIWFFDVSGSGAKKEDSTESQNRSAGGNLRDVRRSIFLLLTNIIEILFIFTYLIIAAIFFDSDKHLYIETLRLYDLFKCSLYYIFNLQDMNIEIMKNMANNTWFELIMIAEQLVRIFIVGVVVTKLLALLPQGTTKK